MTEEDKVYNTKMLFLRIRKFIDYKKREALFKKHQREGFPNLEKENEMKKENERMMEYFRKNIFKKE